MKHEFLRTRTFKVSYDDGAPPFITINKDCNIPVYVTVTDCFSGEIVSRFKTVPKNLYKELVDRGYNVYGQQ